ncbi:hypothetical protein [Niallia circulans]|uniref:hypothetical protein n=1 Tax=Niallia circulans TaxID=1397 RepID=UPI0026ECB617|nr:hypothetical protein [Niallia circulans]
MPIRPDFDKEAYEKRHKEFTQWQAEFKSGKYNAEEYKRVQKILEASISKEAD